MAVENNNSIYLPIEGVNNEHCALIVDKGLSKVAGIATHTIDVNNRRAVITTNGDLEVVPNAIKAIRDLGYEVDTVKKSFPVLNMSCASCASSSQSILAHEPGVVSVSVNYANASAQVEYIPTITDPFKLKAALQGIGYDLMIDESEAAVDELEEQNQRKFDNLKVNTIATLLLSAPTAAIAMFFMSIPYANYIMWVLTTPVLILGRQFFTGAWKQAKHGSANMDTLVALSTGVAYLFSVFNTLFPHFWHSQGLHAHVYFEAASVVIAFILLGKLMEERAKRGTSAAIKKLMGLQPKKVTIVHPGGHQMEIPITSVKVGDTLLTKPGEKIAVDGTVSTGSSFIDESMISGEALPVEKVPGERVFAGTINQKGSFELRADKVGGDTVLAHIIKMVQQAQGSRAPVQKLVDKIAGIFVPLVIIVAIISLLAWILLGDENGLTQGLLALVTVLVVACPCALGLATPTAIMAGVGKGAENGILIKDAESLELAKKVNAIILDKTGTITEGKPVVTDLYWLNQDSSKTMHLVSLEKHSEHPLAAAVVNHFEKMNYHAITGFESITGFGVRGEIAGTVYYVGNKSLLKKNNISIATELEKIAGNWIREAKTVIYFTDEIQALAVVAIADKVKETSSEAIQQLTKAGIEVYMLTGDNQSTAKAIAAQVGIQQFTAEVLPAQKAEWVKKLQQQGKIVAMVGDGINDSAALAQADVSIAMGKGSDVAMEVAKMTIISSDLLKIPQAIKLSKYTVATIRQNLFWAFIYNLIGIPIAAGILYPLNGFLLNPMIAGAVMALSSVSVVANSLRLKTKRI